MTFIHPLTYDSSEPAKTIALYLNKADNDSFEVRVVSNANEDTKQTVHHTSTVSMLDPLVTKARRLREASLIRRQAFYFSTTENHSTLRTKLLYERMFTRVVRYAKEYHTIKELHVASTNLEGYGSFKLPTGSLTKSYIIPPVFTDTLLHAAGFIANLSVEPEEICICTRVDMVEILYGELHFGGTFTIYCHLFDDIQGAIIADAFALDSSGQTIALCCGMEFKKLRLKSFQRSLQSAIKSKPPATEPIEKMSSGGSTLLPSPSSTEAATPKTTEDKLQDVRTSITKTLSLTSGFSEEDLTNASSLADLGVDSLMQIEIASALKQTFPDSSIDQDTIAACDTVQGLEDSIASNTTAAATDHSAATPARANSVIQNNLSNGTLSSHGTPATNGHSTSLINISNGVSYDNSSPHKPALLRSSRNHEATPLFCFHDGSGQGSLYGRMTDINRTLYAFSDLDFATTNVRPRSLGEMAERYAATFSKAETPNVILGGRSNTSCITD